MAEALNSLYKGELIRNKGPWVGLSHLELGTAEHIDWYNHRRLHGEIGHVSPAEQEAAYYAGTTATSTELARLGNPPEPGAIQSVHR